MTYNLSIQTGYINTSFLVTLDYDPGSPENPIVFNVAHLNPGGHYDVTSGIYTVPVDGVYEFMLRIRSLDDASFGVFIEVDNVHVSS